MRDAESANINTQVLFNYYLTKIKVLIVKLYES